MYWNKRETIEIRQVVQIPQDVLDRWGTEEIDATVKELFQSARLSAELERWFAKGDVNLVSFRQGFVVNGSVLATGVFERTISEKEQV